MSAKKRGNDNGTKELTRPKKRKASERLVEVMKEKLRTFNLSESETIILNSNPTLCYPPHSYLQVIIDVTDEVSAVMGMPQFQCIQGIYHIPMSKVTDGDIWVFDMMQSMGEVRDCVFRMVIDLWFRGIPCLHESCDINELVEIIGESEKFWRAYVEKNRGRFISYSVSRQNSRQHIDHTLVRTYVFCLAK